LRGVAAEASADGTSTAAALAPAEAMKVRRVVGTAGAYARGRHRVVIAS
jgi:hypothetical protein